MGQNEHSNADPEGVFDPAIQSEKIAFDSRDMVGCLACGRKNPPNRLACLYCGQTLDVDRLQPSAVRSFHRAFDSGQPAYSVVSVPSRPHEIQDILAAAKLLSLDFAVLQSILEASVPLPLSRVPNESEAAALGNLLSDLGVASTIVDERSLSAEKPPVRLAGMDFLDTELQLTTFNSREKLLIPYLDMVLLVEGVIAVSRVDQNETRKGGKSHSRGETFTVYDEPILDLYSSKNNIGFRIMTTGFDFSSLGEAKRLVAAENLKEITRRLSAACPRARRIDEYHSVRGPLGQVWEIEVRRDAKGLQVTGFGKREISSVESTSNLEQFTKFSRLQRLLL